ncbi:MAG TPA: amidohydrolase [Solirubrobacterales bacterium]|nr:amidohydrolase [Solirubrobacterales bacterium]
MKRKSLRWLLGPVTAGLALLLPGAAGAETPADTVLKNGTILTMDKKGTTKSAVALRNGRIVYTGNARGASRLIGAKTEVINLKGKTAMPGLIDGHAHPLGGGDILDDCDLGNIEATIDDMLAPIQACNEADPATSDEDWLTVSNWSPVGVLPAGTVVTRQDLDRVSSTRPIIVQGSDFHNSWANTRALELAGVTKDTPDPSDGEFVREPDGTPTGLLKDGAQEIVRAAIPPKAFSEVVADGERGVRAMNAVGITSTADAASGEESLKVWRALTKRGKMSLRMNSLPVIENNVPAGAAVKYYRGLAKKYATERLRIPGIKLFIDGVIEYPAQTAALLKPYLEKQGDAMVPGTNKGTLYHTQKHANAITTRFDKMGKLVHMHAIGDGAVRQGLNAAAAARKANHTTGDRNISITHLELVDPADYGRFGKLGVFATMQLQWAVSNFWTQDSLRPFIGEERFNRLYPAGSLVRAGAPLSQGSDWPVDPLNPWNEIMTARTRANAYGGVLDLGESISIARSLRAHTVGSAAQLGLSDRVGSIQRGKDADIIVLDRNPLKAKPKSIDKTRVLRTIVRGRTVYRPSEKSAELISAAASLSTGEAGHSHGH